jgi:hypothetical protein
MAERPSRIRRDDKSGWKVPPRACAEFGYCGEGIGDRAADEVGTPDEAIRRQWDEYARHSAAIMTVIDRDARPASVI